MNIDWKVLSDHLFEKAAELEKALALTRAGDTAALATCGTAAIVLNTLAKGIQKATVREAQP